MAFIKALSVGAWLAVTPSRAALLDLRDRRRPPGTSFDDAEDQLGDVRTLLGGLAKAAKAMAVDLTHSLRLPELAERPDDAELMVRFERLRPELVTVDPVRRYVPLADPAVRLGFADRSWATVETTPDGIAALRSVS